MHHQCSRKLSGIIPTACTDTIYRLLTHQMCFSPSFQCEYCFNTSYKRKCFLRPQTSPHSPLCLPQCCFCPLLSIWMIQKCDNRTFQSQLNKGQANQTQVQGIPHPSPLLVLTLHKQETKGCPLALEREQKQRKNRITLSCYVEISPCYPPDSFATK